MLTADELLAHAEGLGLSIGETVMALDVEPLTEHAGYLEALVDGGMPLQDAIEMILFYHAD